MIITALSLKIAIGLDIYSFHKISFKINEDKPKDLFNQRKQIKNALVFV